MVTYSQLNSHWPCHHQCFWNNIRYNALCDCLIYDWLPSIDSQSNGPSFSELSTLNQNDFLGSQGKSQQHDALEIGEQLAWVLTRQYTQQHAQRVAFLRFSRLSILSTNLICIDSFFNCGVSLSHTRSSLELDLWFSVASLLHKFPCEGQLIEKGKETLCAISKDRRRGVTRESYENDVSVLSPEPV